MRTSRWSRPDTSPDAAVTRLRKAAARARLTGSRILAAGATVDLALIVALCLLPLLFFWRYFTPNAQDLAMVPQGDFFSSMWPNHVFLSRSLAAGDSPFWNPYVIGGHPALADIQYNVFYPFNLLSAWLWPAGDARVLEGMIAVHTALAGVFTYLFARRVIQGRFPAFVAAVTFAYSGYLTSFPIQQTVILQVSVWLPLVLLLLDMGIRDKKTYAFIFAGFVLAIAILAGHPQTAMYAIALALAYAIYQFRASGFTRQTLVGLLSVPVVAFGLSAIQLLPTFRGLSLTTRSSVGFDFASTGFSIRELLGIALPTSIGGLPLYVGIAGLMLAVVGVSKAPRPSVRWFWGLTAFLAAVLSLGGNVFGQPALYAVFPFFTSYRDHERVSFLFAFSAAILAGYGAAALTRSTTAASICKGLRKSTSWLVVACFCLAVVFVVLSAFASDAVRPTMYSFQDRFVITGLVLAGFLGIVAIAASSSPRRTLVAILLGGLILFDLFSTNWRNNLEPGSPAQVYPETAITRTIQADKSGFFRIASEGLLAGGGNAGSVYSLYDVVGQSPLELASWYSFDTKLPETLRWRLLNVKYIVTKRNLDHPWVKLIQRDGERNLYELSADVFLPRAYLRHDVLVVQSEEEALEKTATVDPATTVVLTRVPTASYSPVAKGASESVVIGTYRNGLIEARVSAASAGVLVFSEVNYPGWEAEIDGQPAELFAADYLLRAVEVEAGEHTVRLVYRPPSLMWGIVLSAVTLGLCLATLGALTFRTLRRRRRASPSEHT